MAYREEEILIEKEWQLAWEHIKASKTIYWGLFASLIIINGVAIKYFLGSCPDSLIKKTLLMNFWWTFYIPLYSIITLFLLLINILMSFVYQREHFAQKENYLQINNIRKYQNTIGSSMEWNCFLNKEVFLRGIGYLYFVLIHWLINLIPLFLAFYVSKGRFSNTIFVLSVVYVISLILFYIVNIAFKSHMKSDKKKVPDKKNETIGF